MAKKTTKQSDDRDFAKELLDLYRSMTATGEIPNDDIELSTYKVGNVIYATSRFRLGLRPKPRSDDSGLLLSA